MRDSTSPESHPSRCSSSRLPRRSSSRCPASSSFAHDIPSSVTVLAFVKPEAHRLHVVMRVPLEAMRDVNFPRPRPRLSRLSSARRRSCATRHKLWIADDIELYENDAALAAAAHRRDASLAAVRPLVRDAIDAPLAHATAPPLASATELMWKQAMLDVVLDYPIASDPSRFSIDPTLARLGVRTTTVLRFLPADGAERAFEYVGDPGLVRLDPRWYQAARPIRHARLRRTSSTASTTCCSSSASSFRSGRSGRSSRSSRRSPSRTRSR